MCRMMTILCQWDLNEQIEKLVRLLLYTRENCSRKFHAWLHTFCTQSVNEGLTMKATFSRKIRGDIWSSLFLYLTCWCGQP
jgi:hypothetical protein